MAVNCFYKPPATFGPQMRIIDAITNAPQAQVTTHNPHNYVTGTIIRLDIPEGFGMEQLNQQQATLTVIDNLNFTINVDTTFYTPFGYPTNPNYAAISCPASVPIGEINSILSARVVNRLNTNF